MPISHVDPMDNHKVQSQYDEFIQFVSVAFDEAYPFKEIRKKKNDILKPHIDNDLKILIREKH